MKNYRSRRNSDNYDSEKILCKKENIRGGFNNNNDAENNSHRETPQNYRRGYQNPFRDNTNENNSSGMVRGYGRRNDNSRRNSDGERFRDRNESRGYGEYGETNYGYAGYNENRGNGRNTRTNTGTKHKKGALDPDATYYKDSSRNQGSGGYDFNDYNRDAYGMGSRGHYRNRNRGAGW